MRENSRRSIWPPWRGKEQRSTATEIEDDVQIYDTIVNSTSRRRHRLLSTTPRCSRADFTKVPTRAKRKRKSVQPGFLVVQSKSEHTFYFVQVDNPDEDRLLSENLKKTIAEIPGPPRKARLPIKIRRRPELPAGSTPAQIYAIENWGVAFPQRTAVGESERVWPFFETVDGQLKPKELTTKKGELSLELFDAPFCPFHNKTTDIEVYLPRIDFGAHRTFLSSKSAF